MSEVSGPEQWAGRVVAAAGPGAWCAGAFRLLEEQSGSDVFAWVDRLTFEGTAAFKLLLDLKPESSVLCIGDSDSCVPVSLARSCGRLVVLDPSAEKLRLARRLASTAGVDGFACVRHEDRTRLPFDDSSFDVVVLNGTLAEVAQSSGTRRVRQVHLALLQDVKRVLKKDGQAYVGAANRFSAAFFRGHREKTTGMRYCTLLPSPVANLCSHFVRGKPYRAPTYSRAGYQRLFEETGFASFAAYSPWPDFRDPRQIVSLEAGEKGLAFSPRGHRAELYRWIFGRRSLRVFVPGFGFVLQKGARTPSLLDAIVARVLGEDRGCVNHYLVTRRNTVLIFCSREGSAPKEIVIKVPLTPRAAERSEANRRGLDRIAALCAGSALEGLFPTRIGEGEVRGQVYAVEGRLAGASADDRVPGARRLGFIRDRIGPLLQELANQATWRTALPEAWVSDAIDRAGAGLEPVLRNDRDRELWQRLAARVRESAARWPTALGFIHGDFHLGNVLVDGEGDRVFGIIDWDRVLEGAPLLLDAVHVLMCHGPRHGRTAFSEAVSALADGTRRKEAETAFLDELCRAWDAPAECLPYVTALYWMHQVVPHAEGPLRIRPSFYEDMIVRSLRRFDALSWD
ncbi:MAG: phosphotransferase [Planctomycetota bacterium]|nr:phosphotransferase [Planctomycetota bacterium]